MFGAFEFERDGVAVDLGSTKQRLILLALALQPGTIVSSGSLIEWVWPDDPPKSALTTMRSYVSNLRKAIDPDARGRSEGLLVTKQPGYMLNVNAADTDLGVFDSYLNQAAESDNPADKARLLDAAFALAGQPFLPDFAYDDAVMGSIRWVEERLINARADRIEIGIQRGEGSRLIAELEALVEAEPNRERLAALQMRALYSVGRQADALAAYQRIRESLADGLGLEPAPALRELEGQILRQDPSLDVAQAAVLPGFDVAPVGRAVVDEAPIAEPHGEPKRLTLPTSLLIGRANELDSVEALLSTSRLVTIVGPGGVGKTRLAIEAASIAEDRYSDGVAVVELAPVDASEGVAEVVAEGLGARQQPGMTLDESIVDYLEGRRMLVVLDNCEHQLGRLSDLVEKILQVDGPTVVSTSREAMGIAGEQVFILDPLDPKTDGVALFTQRASERDPDFELAANIVPAVERICVRLDGIPLAIELAAARVRVLGPVELADGLDDRFRVLAAGRRHGRHETLHDAVQWSYELLDEPIAELFDRLSIFAGGFTLQAADAVCYSDAGVDIFVVLDRLTALVDKSMIMSETVDGRVRFSLLETLREFGLERLQDSGQHDELADRHASYFATVAEENSELLMSSKEPEVWLQLDTEWGNIRVAFERLIDVDRRDEAITLVLSLLWFSTFSMRIETFSWIDVIGKLDGIDAHPEHDRLTGASAIGGYLTLDESAPGRARAVIEAGLPDPGSLNRIALSATYLNNVFSEAESDELTTNWLASADMTDIESWIWAMGMRIFHLGTFAPEEDSSKLCKQLVHAAQETGSPSAMAIARWAQGISVAVPGSDPRPSFVAWQVGLEQARLLDEGHLMVHLLDGLLLFFSASHGPLETVIPHCRRTLKLARDQHYVVGQSHLFGVAAVLLVRSGREGVAGELIGAMLGNGLKARPNAEHIVRKALADDFDLHRLRGEMLTINEAGLKALAELDAAYDELLS